MNERERLGMEAQDAENRLANALTNRMYAYHNASEEVRRLEYAAIIAVVRVMIHDAMHPPEAA